MNNVEITHINDVLSAIEGRSEFVVKRDANLGIIVVNYNVNFSDTFPSPFENGISAEESRRRKILRECRGITFDYESGHILSRKFHKFFNVGEVQETKTVDFTKGHVILEKLDGSMISPLVINGEVILCTKMGPTDISKQAERFVQQKGLDNYIRFCHDMLNNGYTPLFEWCSRENRIVIDYPNPRLVLLAVRENVSGNYVPFDNMVQLANSYGIDVVQKFDISHDFDEFVNYTKGLENMEGFVVRFHDDHMVKVKGDWYTHLHKTISAMQLEKNVVKMILENDIDDIRGSVDESVINALDGFSTDMHSNIENLVDNLAWVIVSAYDNYNGSKRDFAINVANTYSKVYQPILFQSWQKFANMADGNDVEDLKHVMFNLVVNTIIEKTNRQSKLDEIKPLFGNLNWHDYYVGKDIE